MNKFPFTATQWQELEHQALIFKYMVSGIPIPPDLLYTLRRNYLDSSNKLLISHHSQHVGWNFFQAGLGRKIDPEPGRCRRTDGKKWRCSKEAFPDSKYCERHMHRGKNRSRKPVEVLKTQQTVGTVSNNNTTNSATSSPMLTNIHRFDQNPPFAYPHQCHSSSYSRPIGERDNNTTSLVFDSDLRYCYGVKDEVDEHAFFSEEPSRRTSLRGFSDSGTPMEDSWQLTPLTISCSPHSSSSSSSSSSKQTQLQSAHYYHHNKNDTEEDETQKTTRLFFDEWPMKPKLDLDDKSNSTTQLSISMPNPSRDFPIFTSRTR